MLSKPNAGMHAVDTNVVIRFMTADDPEQAQKARTLFGREPVFLSRTVLLEVEWVLRGVYRMPVAKIVPALRALAGLPGVTVENAQLVAEAMDWADAGMDFADALTLASSAECEDFLTFDPRFRRRAQRLGGIPVSSP